MFGCAENLGRWSAFPSESRRFWRSWGATRVILPVVFVGFPSARAFRNQSCTSIPRILVCWFGLLRVEIQHVTNRQIFRWYKNMYKNISQKHTAYGGDCMYIIIYLCVCVNHIFCGVGLGEMSGSFTHDVGHSETTSRSSHPLPPGCGWGLAKRADWHKSWEGGQHHMGGHPKHVTMPTS